MKFFILLSSIFLYSLSFNLFAKEVCDNYKFPDREVPIFFYGLDIDQKKLDTQITRQVDIYHSVTCHKDSTAYTQIELLEQFKSDTEAQKKLVKADPTQVKDLEKTIENIDKQLSVFMSKHNTLSTELNTACKIPTSLTPFLDKDMAECLTLLKQQLEFEIKQYPFNQAIPEDASDAQKKVIADLNTLNKIKYDYAKSDLNMVESLSGTDELEKAPRSTAILQKYVRDNNLFGNDTNILIDILDTKSAEIAIFRQKIKVLERNSRVLLSKDDFYGGCGTFDEDNSVNMSYKGDICRLARSLNTKLNKTLKLSYDDSWFENKNIESDIKDIESLTSKLDMLQKQNLGSTAQNLNFLNHANQYFTKYNGTGRFNIGLGASLFNAPDIINPLNYSLDLSQFSVGNLEPQMIDDQLNIPSGKQLSPVIVGTMPWVDVTLTLPSYSKNISYTSSINTWELPLEGEQTQHAFLSQTTIESNYEVDYDVNITFKIFSFLEDNCLYWCFSFNNKTRGANIELAVGVGTTDIQLTKAFATDIREQIDLNGGYSQLANSYQLNTEETIDHSMMYFYLGGHYYMADQIRLEAYLKRYKNDFKDGQIKLTTRSTWGVSVSYLFF